MTREKLLPEKINYQKKISFCPIVKILTSFVFFLFVYYFSFFIRFFNCFLKGFKEFFTILPPPFSPSHNLEWLGNYPTNLGRTSTPILPYGKRYLVVTVESVFANISCLIRIARPLEVRAHSRCFSRSRILDNIHFRRLLHLTFPYTDLWGFLLVYN